MKLIKGVTKNKYINIDMITDVWESEGKYFCAIVSGSFIEIPLESFNTILKYGKT